ncbi:HYC_CC_PP family protein [Pseudofulvibacter geojedonensis]|uniref:Secreted protein n=1 Tax=Pseudofulvibacter geojedonensis TaxID=1123758 RepID=A0ABW3I360_9FLAO
MPFKKQIAIFLSILYLSISGGFAVNLHYCGGELESVSTLLTDIVCEEEAVEDKCCSEEKDIPNDCCDDEQIDFNEVDDDTTLNTSVEFFVVNAILPNFETHQFYESEQLKKTALPYYTFQSNAPPLYKLHCSLVFYA